MILLFSIKPLTPQGKHIVPVPEEVKTTRRALPLLWDCGSLPYGHNRSLISGLAPYQAPRNPNSSHQSCRFKEMLLFPQKQTKHNDSFFFYYNLLLPRDCHCSPTHPRTPVQESCPCAHSNQTPLPDGETVCRTLQSAAFSGHFSNLLLPAPGY